VITVTRYKIKIADNEDDANQILEEMVNQGYEPVTMQYEMKNNGNDFYEGVCILFKEKS
jgi:hypothetical protein